MKQQRQQQPTTKTQFYHSPSTNVPAPLACLMHYLVVGGVSTSVHDLLLLLEDKPTVVTTTTTTTKSTQTIIGWFFGIYAIWLLVTRLWTISAKAAALAQQPTTTTRQWSTLPQHIVWETTHAQNVVWYEMAWLCNVTLVMAAWSLVTHRPLLAWAHGLTVAIDQLLWYVDGVVYVATGKTLVGVFNHIILDAKTHRWYHHLTTWHHIWT